jgi:hypothetical protein
MKQLYNPEVIENMRASRRLAGKQSSKATQRRKGFFNPAETRAATKENMSNILNQRTETPDKIVNNWLESLDSAREEAIQNIGTGKKELGELKPRSRDEGGLDPSLDEQAQKLFKDPTFKENFESILQEYPNVSRYELLRIIDGESNFDPKARNKDTNASGLFQFIPKVAAELGFTPEEIRDMPPSSQLLVYKKYLKKWKYDGTYSLGLLQAAPAKRNASPNTIIYKKGSDAWNKNPGWRDKETGNITKASIDAYYRRNM